MVLNEKFAPKIWILSVVTHPCVFPNLYDILFTVETQNNLSENISSHIEPCRLFMVWAFSKYLLLCSTEEKWAIEILLLQYTI